MTRPRTCWTSRGPWSVRGGSSSWWTCRRWCGRPMSWLFQPPRRWGALPATSAPPPDPGGRRLRRAGRTGRSSRWPWWWRSRNCSPRPSPVPDPVDHPGASGVSDRATLTSLPGRRGHRHLRGQDDLCSCCAGGSPGRWSASRWPSLSGSSIPSFEVRMPCTCAARSPRSSTPWAGASTRSSRR